MTQPEALEILKTGENVFLTGAAGSGKTYLLNQYVAFLKENKIEVAITASTGLAATHINGRTIHSWCGMGINEKLSREQIENLRMSDKVADRILGANVLIIDEISMLSASRLDLANHICQAIRQDKRAFGGLQVILCGDFFQLPPVSRGNGEDSRFVVESAVWSEMDLKICYLSDQYRQEDKDFLAILSAIRQNATTEENIAPLSARLNQPTTGGFKATKLYAHNKNVDAENLAELKKLAGERRGYEMQVQGIPSLVKSLKDSYCLAPENLDLKIGAVVMFVRNNFDKGYVNGTLGQVVDFNDDSGYPVVKILSGRKIIATPELWVIDDGYRTLASVSQVPLRLAWAITVHKSQGMSLDCAEIDLGRAFEFGMGYVALSRVRTLSGLSLLGLNAMALRVNEKAIELDKKLRSDSARDLKEYRKQGAWKARSAQKSFISRARQRESVNWG